MKVLLYKPFFPDIAVIPPMGLCYIAAVLERNNISVEILDNTLLNLSPEELRDNIQICLRQNYGAGLIPVPFILFILIGIVLNNSA